MAERAGASTGLPGRGAVVLAAGVGVTGLPVVRLLVERGCRVLVTANRKPPAELFELADDPRAGGTGSTDGTSGPAGTGSTDGASGTVVFLGDPRTLPDGADRPELVVTSAGIPPHHPLLEAASAAGIEVIGEVELAWRLDHGGPDRAGADQAGDHAGDHAEPGAGSGPSEDREWLVVTGTNGKTTTITMLAAMLRSGGLRVTASGNVGWPVLEAVLAGTDGDAAGDAGPGRQDVIAAELSSFQLHYAPSLHPTAGVVLNLAEDHLDWHGSMAGYAADKARALTGDVAVAVVDDAGAAALLADSPAPLRVGVTLGEPAPGQLGVIHSGGVVGSRHVYSDGDSGMVVENGVAWPGGDPPAERELFAVADLRLPGDHNLTNAMAAAALARAVGVQPEAIAAAVRELAPASHRNELVAAAETAGGTVTFVNDSKATNPHAAAASLLAYPRVVWLAGGQLKGASVDELVRQVAGRLAGVVLFGVDAPVIAQALRRHASDVPRIELSSTDDETMQRAVSAAWQLATAATDTVEATGQSRGADVTVLLAPAAASLDMFASYAARGEAFAAAARQLAGQVGR